jgi:hypothetical protein
MISPAASQGKFSRRSSERNIGRGEKKSLKCLLSGFSFSSSILHKEILKALEGK